MAIFNFEGKIPLQSDWLIIKDKGSAIRRDISFNKCVDIKSCPALFFGAKLCITEMTSSRVTGTKLKVELHRSFK